MEVAMLFASLPGKDGRALSARAKKYCKRAVQFLKKDPHRCVIIAKAALGFRPKELYSKLIQHELEILGTPKGQILVFPITHISTLGEIESAEACIKHTPRNVTMYAISSWQHLPRILFLWKLRYGRKIKPLWVLDFNAETILQLVLEPFKFLFGILSPKTQARLMYWFYKAIHRQQ